MAAHSVEITCQSCAQQFTAGRRWASVRKYCPVCQVVRDSGAKNGLARSAKQCSDCDRSFWPIRGGSSWTRCGYCEVPPLSQTIRCKRCDGMGRVAAGLQNTCVGCVQSTQELRDQYVTQLRSLVMERRAEHLAETA